MHFALILEIDTAPVEHLVGVLLALEDPVEGRAGHAGRLEQVFDPHRLDAVLGVG